MIRRPTRLLPCLVLLLMALPLAAAAPLNLPKNAIGDDTFLVARVDLAKADPDALEAAVKAALGDKAAEVEEEINQYKKYHEACTAAGADTATVVIRNDTNLEKEPRVVIYVHVKPGADHGALEKRIREDEGENAANPLVISTDGDFLVLHAKDSAPPEAGSDDRAGAFAQAIGAAADKPLVAAVIMTQLMIDEAQKNLARGMPPAIMSLVNDAKSFRLDLTLGEMPRADVTLTAADDEGAKRLSDAMKGLSSLLATQVAQLKQLPPQARAQLPPNFDEMVESMSTIAEAMKQDPKGTTVSISGDAKSVAGILHATVVARRATVGPTKAGGL